MLFVCELIMTTTMTLYLCATKRSAMQCSKEKKEKFKRLATEKKIVQILIKLTHTLKNKQKLNNSAAVACKIECW